MKISRIQIIGNAFFLIFGIILAVQFFSDSLSVNPIQSATVITGRVAIYALLFSLYCSPLIRILKMSVFHHLRKMTGIYGFVYGLAHFLIFYFLDFQGNLDWIIPELKFKPFLQIGLLALILLTPLAISSLKFLKKKMGKWWKRLHYLTYLTTILVLTHAAIASKGDIIDPAILIGLFILAMLFRITPLRRVAINKLPQKLRKLNTFLIQSP